MKDSEAIQVIIEDFMVTYTAPGLSTIWGRQLLLWEKYNVDVYEDRTSPRPSTNFERQQVKNRCDRVLSIDNSGIIRVHHQPDTVYILANKDEFRYYDVVAETVERVAKMLDFKVVYNTDGTDVATSSRRSRQFFGFTPEQVARYTTFTSPFVSTTDIDPIIFDPERPF